MSGAPSFLGKKLVEWKCVAGIVTMAFENGTGITFHEVCACNKSVIDLVAAKGKKILEVRSI